MLYFYARVAGNSSLSYFRLALKLAAIGRYDLALDRMMKALQADKWNKMNNWGVALMTLFVGLLKSRQVKSLATFAHSYIKCTANLDHHTV